jgi:hypothetical protein
MLQHVLALRLPTTSREDSACRSPQVAAAVNGVAAAAAELEGPLRPQHLQLIGELQRRLDQAVAQGEEAQAALLMDACAAILEGRNWAIRPQSYRAAVNVECTSQVRCTAAVVLTGKILE